MNKEKYILVIPGASPEELEEFQNVIKSNKKYIVTNSNCKMFRLVDGELYEVVPSISKVRTEKWNIYMTN